MTGLIVAVSLLAAHVVGAIDVIAPVLGPIGTVISTTDKVVSDAINIHNYVKQKHLARKAVK